ncbi:hypothetical protein AAZX31_20G007800 [Glycine max]|uniref:Uncharacterized protein n=2 Tax=Glycine subgen. Soja TaxID=1462606 RepID=C6T1V7_SOYBN|nr:uncharacterized protein LOC100500479 [Glycine max]KAG4908824.1 hypothetical protein JHK87_054940 [Glycine soja]ACU15568.1 unknown [Glycine max]KAG4906221.1 hypothetical protein JHK86_054705 [Glycine max]KAG4917383.1 hypothetical protein JHK85_055664 [Glycine max]KAG5076160.1 hypothetical protein JHK82_054855 [Glycine max]|eukprot:NP_001351460.1 uncharacterized protein LOC100500479 [Glycine max]
MFEPRDMWTKLKEKGETIFSNAGWIHREPSQGIQGKEKSSPGLAVVAGQQHVQVHTPRMMYSEASVSMLVECFSA